VFQRASTKRTCVQEDEGKEERVRESTPTSAMMITLER